MFKKLAIIGLATALIGCGTTNRALANDIFTQGPKIDYDGFFTETTIVMGVLNLLKEKPCVAPVNKTPVFYNHKKQDQSLDNVISQYPYQAYNVTIASPTFPNHNRRTYMKIPFVVRWNQNYVNQLYNAVASSQDQGGTGWAKFVNKKHWSTPGYDIKLDRTSSDKLMRGLYRAQPMIQVRVGTRSLGCFDIPELSNTSQRKAHMVQPSGNGTVINGYLELASHVTVEISPSDNIGNARIFVVRSNQCR
jgi:hypothetical protein